EKDDPRSEPMLRRAITMAEKLKGADDVAVTPSLKALADTLTRRGDAAAAEGFYVRATANLELPGDLGDPRRASSLLDFAHAELARSYSRRDPKKATDLMKRALEIYRRSLGPRHPTVATTLVGLAKLAIADKRIDDALVAMREAGEIREASLDLLLYAGSE